VAPSSVTIPAWAEALVQYIVFVAVFLAVAATAGMIMVARHESRLVPRPSMMAARQVLRKSRRLVVAGDQCLCGGVLGPSGRVSAKFGPLMGCTGCDRTWTMSGRRIVRRAVRRSPADS
jgi:hypothetical protein